MTDLLDLELAARTAHEAASAATVAIGRAGRGSGVVIGAGRVLTNAHNLRDRTTQVTFADGRREQGAVVAADVATDLVVLEVGTEDLAPPDWSDEPASVGSVVFAAARGGRGGRLTVGFVSAVDRSFRGPDGRVIDGAVEHTAPMGRGSSGGPLLDRAGRVVGINTHRLGGGFYVALAADDALRRRVDALAEGREPVRVELGVSVAPPEVARRLRRSVGLEDRAGVLVREVRAGGPADRAGIREGDLIVGAGDRDVTSVDDLHRVLDAHDASAAVELVVVRGEQERRVTVEVGGGKDAEI